MDEIIFNFFLFTDNKEIIKLGYKCHAYTDDDGTSMDLLQQSVEKDIEECTIFDIPDRFKPLSIQKYNSFTRTGEHLHLFEEIFSKYESVKNPFTCITFVQGSKPKIDYVNLGDSLNYDNHQDNAKVTGVGIMHDYLQAYKINGQLNVTALLNDDFIKAIKLLFNAKKYVSCAKLIVSFIDTMAFIEYGDDSKDNIFQKWLNEYCNITDITACELWEFRNSLLHMSNIDSRKHLKGTVIRISFYIGDKSKLANSHMNGIKYFCFTTFKNELMTGVGKWLTTYNNEPYKFETFVERYDKILSDARMSIAYLDS